MRKWCRSRCCALLLLLMLAATARADFHPREINVFISSGKSAETLHGEATLRSIHLELAGRVDWMKLRDTDVGVALVYSDVRQPRFLFPLDGDPKDDVRAGSAYFFVRKRWTRWTAAEPYIDLGSGPMWSNRQIPAQTSRVNFQSQITGGAIWLPRSRFPLFTAYRFSHISNGGFAPRNPGVNVYSVIVGTRVVRFR
ncbi:MAG: acyloxyacyl hydrolase [Acidobacteriota bacterium]